MNCVGMARSNYFKVKDPDAFKKALEDVNVRIVEKESAGERYFGLLSEEECGWPSRFESVDDPADCDEIDVNDIVAEHLADGEIAVLMEAGYEGQRYCWGHARAFDSTGESVRLSIDDIYDLAAAKFGKLPNSAAY